MAGMTNALVTVATSGTEIQFVSTDTPIKSILIDATAANSGNVFIGANGVTTANAPPLKPGEQMSIVFMNGTEGETPGMLSDLYVDAAVNGETITYLAVTV